MLIKNLPFDYSNNKFYLNKINKARAAYPDAMRKRALLARLIASFAIGILLAAPVATTALAIPAFFAPLALLPLIPLAFIGGFFLAKAFDKKFLYWEGKTAEILLLEKKKEESDKNVKTALAKGKTPLISDSLRFAHLQMRYGALLGKKDKVQEALEAFKKISSFSTESYCAEAYRLLEDWEKGKKEAKKVLKRDAQDPFALATLGSLYLRQGRFDKAIQNLEQAEKNYLLKKSYTKDLVFVWTELGEAYLKQDRKKNFSRAEALFQKALKRIPDHPYPLNRLRRLRAQSIWERAQRGLVYLLSPKPIMARRLDD